MSALVADLAGAAGGTAGAGAVGGELAGEALGPEATEESPQPLVATASAPARIQMARIFMMFLSPTATTPRLSATTIGTARAAKRSRPDTIRFETIRRSRGLLRGQPFPRARVLLDY